MVKLASVFTQLHPRKALVIGDFMLDRYTFGKVGRISPEAPVPVVHVEKEEMRPGGAGNVALNLVSLGMTVVALGRVGNDWGGDVLISSLNKEGINTTKLMVQEGMATPQKNRIIAQFQQIVRIDHENIVSLDTTLEREVIASIPLLLNDVNVVALSDYAKGFLSDQVLKAVIAEARSRSIPIIADPKGVDLSKYAGATIIKPNLGEAILAANLRKEASLDEIAQSLHACIPMDVLMITRSESGISLFYPDGSHSDFPVRARQVKDVTGAGDTVLAVVACAIANQITLHEAVELANIAAGIAIEQVGCARVTLSDIAHRMFDLHALQKIFYQEHFPALKQALKGRKCQLILLDEHSACLSSSLLQSIRHLSQDSPQKEICLYIQHPFPDEEFLNIMASLEGIDYIFFGEESPRLIVQSIQPSKVFVFKDKQLQEKLISVQN